MRRRLAAAVAALAVLSLGTAAWRERGRARRLAPPVLADPSDGPAPALPLAEGPPCAAQEVARVGARVTALLEASDGELWIGTSDRGVLRAGPSPGAEAREGLPPGAEAREGLPPGAEAREGLSSGADAREGLSPGAEAREDVPGSAPEPVGGLAGRQLLVNALVEHDGLVWAATQGGLVALDGDRRVLALLGGEAVPALAAARGALYAGTARGLHRVGVDGAERVDVAGPSGEPLRPTALAASRDRLWIGTASGVYALSLASLDAPLLARTARWHPLVQGDPPAETNGVTALAPLGDGAVAGTDDGGLVLVRGDGRVSAWRFADARANEVSPGAAALALDGAVLAGTRGGGLLVARPAAGGLEVARAGGIGVREISAVAPAPGGALLGTAEGAVVRIACAVPAS